MSKSEFGLLGLGVMGKSLAINLAEKGVRLSVFNREVPGKEESVAKKFSEEFAELTIDPHADLQEFVASIEAPRNILVMVNAGKPVDAVIEELIPLLDQGDMIIDAGNSHYDDTTRRANYLEEKGLVFLGTGVSGGEEGARKGPSIMPGGSRSAYERAGKYLELIAAKDKTGKPCCTYVGPEGSGHFVKMVHNGIEYADMQLIAELYHMLRYHSNAGHIEISGLFSSWRKEGADSYLLEISADILRKREGEGFLIDAILDAAGQKGTGGWSTNAALSMGMPLDTISAAVMARNVSGLKSLRVAAQASYGLKPTRLSNNVFADGNTLRHAYQAARIINHAIGFHLIRKASEDFNWQLDLSEISRIWTNGCIIRSELMENMAGWFKQTPDANLLLNPTVIGLMKEYKSDLSDVLSMAIKAGVAMPVMSAAANYFYAFTSGQSSANMIQAQRDYFGAHTYKRVDKPIDQNFHTVWKN